jgi:hypothetical protein
VIQTPILGAPLSPAISFGIELARSVTNTCALTIAPIKVGQALGRIDPDLPAEGPASDRISDADGHTRW